MRKERERRVCFSEHVDMNIGSLSIKSNDRREEIKIEKGT